MSAGTPRSEASSSRPSSASSSSDPRIRALKQGPPALVPVTTNGSSGFKRKLETLEETTETKKKRMEFAFRGGRVGGRGGGRGGNHGGERAWVPYVQWSDSHLREMIASLNDASAKIKASTAEYLKNQCYKNEPLKDRMRLLGGIPPLVALLSCEQLEVHLNACAALRNISFGWNNDIKRALHEAGAIPLLVQLLRRSTDRKVQELVTGILLNLSSCEELKRVILDDALAVLVSQIIIPHSGWDRKDPGPTLWSGCLRMALNILRNVSSAGIEADQKEAFVDALLYLLRGSYVLKNADEKSVEHVIYILQNSSRADLHPFGTNRGCLGGKTTDAANRSETVDFPSSPTSTTTHSTAYKFGDARDQCPMATLSVKDEFVEETTPEVGSHPEDSESQEGEEFEGRGSSNVIIGILNVLI